MPKKTPNTKPPGPEAPIPLLPEATLEQLVIEFAHRADNALIVLSQNTGKPDEKFRMMYTGGTLPAVGLAETARSELLRRLGMAHEMTDREADRP